MTVLTQSPLPQLFQYHPPSSVSSQRLLTFSYFSGIANPVTTSEAEYRASTAISSQFTDLILQQVHDTTKLDQKTIKAKKVVIKQAKEVQLKALYKNLSEKLSLIRQKSLELGCEKGA